MDKIFKYFFSLMLLTNVLAVFSQTTIYKSIEPDGTTLFSDTPSKNSHEINLESAPTSDKNTVETTGDNATPTTSAASVASPTTNVTDTTTSHSSIPYTLQIMSPENQTTIPNQTPIAVSVRILPPLQNDDRLQLIVDGKPYGSPENTTTVTLNDLDRGTHQIQAGIVDAQTKSITNVSLPITIYKYQATILLPPKPPAPK